MADATPPSVLILCGSDSDAATMTAAARTLADFGIEWDLRVSSAHRAPERTIELARTAADRGHSVIIAGAGLAAHLPGVVASVTIASRHRRAAQRGSDARHRRTARDRADATRRSPSRPSASTTPPTPHCSRSRIFSIADADVRAPDSRPKSRHSPQASRPPTRECSSSSRPIRQVRPTPDDDHRRVAHVASLAWIRKECERCMTVRSELLGTRARPSECTHRHPGRVRRSSTPTRRPRSTANARRDRRARGASTAPRPRSSWRCSRSTASPRTYPAAVGDRAARARRRDRAARGGRAQHRGGQLHQATRRSRGHVSSRARSSSSATSATTSATRC